VTGTPSAAEPLATPTDGDPYELLAQGFDVVIHLGSRDPHTLSGRPLLLSVLWRDGLVDGCQPPPPFWVRFDAAAGGFVRVVEEPEAA
jgi:hypothetical protein